MYLLAFVVSWLAPLISNLIEVAGVENDNYYVNFSLNILTSITMPLTGFLNSMVYGWNIYTMKKAYATLLYGIFCCGYCRACAYSHEGAHRSGSPTYPHASSDDSDKRLI